MSLKAWDKLRSSLRQNLGALPDARTGENTHFSMADIAVSAFSVFFTQCPSFLAHQKTIELRLGERVSAVVLDRILRGDDQERLRQRMSFSIHGDLRFVHGFKKRGLCARRGAVDFVGEDHVGENRPGAKFKFA